MHPESFSGCIFIFIGGIMKFLTPFIILSGFLIMCLASPASAVGDLTTAKSDLNASAPADGDALFKQSEEMEWFNAGGLPDEIDAVYEQAANAGNPYAKFYIVHLKSLGVNPDMDAIKAQWCSRLPEIIDSWKSKGLKDPEAAYQLSLYYSNGVCVPRDTPKSLGYLFAAAMGESAKAQSQAGRIIISSFKDAETGLNLLGKASEANLPSADFYLAGFYLGGAKGVKPDPKKAEARINKILSSNNLNVKHMLAVAYLDGDRGFPKDAEKGRAMLEELAAKGHSLAKRDLESLK